MLRILRAFAWMRWRILLSSLERRASRDVLERFSIAFEQLAPAIVLLVMVPSGVALAGVSAYAGWALAHGEPRVLAFELVRFLLLAGCVFAVVAPMMLPTGERTNAVRLLLLPIPRGVLYLGQVMSTLVDPWILLIVAVVLALPLGLVAGGAPGSAAAIAAVSGALLLLVLAGLGLTITSAVHLVVRNRRRGELFALILFLMLPLIGILPGLLSGQEQQRTPTGQAESRERQPPWWWPTVERIAVAAVPSELFVSTVRSAARADYHASARPLLALAGAAGLLHGLAFAAFTRVLSSPGAIGSSRTRTGASMSGWRLPGASPGTSAVALNQLRLALRTPRGRSTILSPVVVFVMFAAIMFRNQSGMDLGFIRLQGGIALAAFASFVSLLSILPLAMNQFAIDRSGFTLAMLSPLETRALLLGKAIGNGVIAAIPAGFCIVGAAALFPSGDPALWLSVPLTLIATYLLVAPAAATLSAIFPRSVDLNSIGRGSNAHGAASLLGTLAFAAAGVPCLLLVLLAIAVFERPGLAPLFLLGWGAACATASTFLLRAATAVFDRRRENLGLAV